MASELRVNKLTNRSGLCTVTYTDTGAIVSSGLTATGTLTTTGDFSIADKIIHTGDTNTALRFPSTDTFTVETAGTERLRIASTGKVGIGTDNPAEVLEIGNDHANPAIRLNDSSNRRMSIRGPSSTYLASVGTDSNNTLVFYTNGYSNERLRITSAGKVGINTTNPGTNLTVWANDGVTDTDVFQVRSKTGAFNIQVSDSDAANPEWAIRTYSSEAIVFKQATTERVRIADDGHIGIGTDNPSSEVHLQATAPVFTVKATNASSGLRLNVLGQTGGGNGQLFRVQRDSTTKLQLNDDGDLVITGDDNAELKLICGTSSGNNILAFLNSSSSTRGNITYDSDNDFLLFNVNQAERARITSAGNLGIGTDNPQVRLTVSSDSPAVMDVHHVDGGTNDEARIILGALALNPPSNRGAGIAAVNNGAGHDLIVKCSASHSAGPTEKVRITSAGKMGLGTNSPTALLHVSGASSPTILNKPSDATPALFIGDSNRTSNGQHLAEYRGLWNGTLVSRMVFSAGNDTTNKDNGNIDFYTASAGTTNLRLRITPGGEVLAGGVTDSVAVTGGAAPFQVRGSSGYTGMSLIRTAAAGAQLQFAAGSSGNNIEDGDGLGYIKFFGYHTNGYDEYARIYGVVDGTPGDGDAPGALVFSTTADGASSGSERLRIRPDGEILMGTANTGSADTLYVTGPTNSGQSTVKILGNGNNSPQANTCALDVQQNCTSAPNTSPALKLTHTNPLAGNEGAIMSIYTNINNGTAQHGWVYHTTGRVIHNRPSTDGTLFSFRHNNTAEGSISVSGSSVSYGGGVLTRWSQLVGISTNVKSDRPTIYQGTVMSNLDEMCEWTGEENMQLNKTQVSTASGDKNVAGVFWAWDDDDDVYTNDFYIAQTGDYIIRVGAATTVTRGDLLESAGDGTAKPQSDDIVRSKTIAKIISTTSTATYADGSKAYPCVLMAC